MDRPWIEAGLKFAAVQDSDVPSLLVQRVSRLRGTSRLDTRFLKHVVAGRAFTDYILSVQTGTTVPHISANQILGYRFRLPPLGDQRRIADILGTLDDKIELNRRMAETLRSTAAEVYRQVAGMASRDAAIGDVADVIDCLHSKKPERRETGRPLLQLNNIREDGLLDMADPYLIDEPDYRLWISRIEAAPGDCVITNVGRVGAVAQIPSGARAALGRNMTAVRCRSDFPYPTFLLQALLSDHMRDEITLRTDTGTILDALNVRNIPRLRLPLPGRSDLLRFERMVRPVRARMEQTLAESSALKAIRDALLPRLLSGVLEVAA
jgi:type I restriction enzyme S subunit